LWSHDGILCTGESYKAIVKLTFAKGASLKGPVQALQLEPGRKHPGCAIDIHEGEEVDAGAFKTLIRSRDHPQHLRRQAKPKRAK